MPAKDSKLICITGATRGLGRAMAEGFIARGHTVVGCGRSKKDIAALTAKFGAPHTFEAVDVTRDGDVGAWAKRILASLGAPDLLLNNAALINKNAPLWKVPATEFDAVVDVNIKGVANVLRYFVPAMIQKKLGVIVNFSSGWGRSTSPDVAPYCATKWAIEGLTHDGSGTARRIGGDSAESGDHQHRHAAELFRRKRGELSRRERVGRTRGAVSA